MFSLLTYLVREGCIHLLLQLFHHLRVCCQIVRQESERAAGRFIASKEENHCLGKDLMICQTWGGRRDIHVRTALSWFFHVWRRVSVYHLYPVWNHYFAESRSLAEGSPLESGSQQTQSENSCDFMSEQVIGTNTNSQLYLLFAALTINLDLL